MGDMSNSSTSHPTSPPESSSSPLSPPSTRALSPVTHVELTHSLLSVSDVCSLVTHPGCGAVSLFVGTTRDLFEGKEVVSLEYEAYQGMAETQMTRLCEEARQRWSVCNIAVVHRLGVVEVCEASIIVAVSSVHRGEAMAATTFIMERVKARVPVWKKEVYSDGSKSWKENKECTWKTTKAEQKQ